MKILDVDSLQKGIEQTMLGIETQHAVIRELAMSVKGLSALKESFTGRGGVAILGFYEENHVPLLELIADTLQQYSGSLSNIAEMEKRMEPSYRGFIRESYLHNEIPASLHDLQRITVKLTEEGNGIMQTVSDIVSLPPLQDERVIEGIRLALKQKEYTQEQLHAFDQAATASLEAVEEKLKLINRYITLLKTIFIDRDIKDNSYSIPQLRELMEFAVLKSKITLESSRIKASKPMKNQEPLKEIRKLKKTDTSWLDQVFTIPAKKKVLEYRPIITNGIADIQDTISKGYANVEEVVFDSIEKSAKSIEEIASDGWNRIENRREKMTDSPYDFVNYLLMGIPGGAKSIMELNQDNWNQMMEELSVETVLEWTTMGLPSTIKGTFQPEEPLSKEHLLNSIGVFSAIVAPYAGKGINKGIKSAAKPSFPEAGAVPQPKSIGPRIQKTLEDLMPIGSQQFVVPGVGRVNMPKSSGYQMIENGDRAKDTSNIKITSKTFGKPLETTINGKKVKLRVDAEPDGNKIQIQAGGGKNSIVDVRIDPKLPLKPQVPKQLNLTKGQKEELLKNLQKAVDWLNN